MYIHIYMYTWRSSYQHAIALSSSSSYRAIGNIMSCSTHLLLLSWLLLLCKCYAIQMLLLCFCFVFALLLLRSLCPSLLLLCYCITIALLVLWFCYAAMLLLCFCCLIAVVLHPESELLCYCYDINMQFLWFPLLFYDFCCIIAAMPMLSICKNYCFPTLDL